ncbi:MAG: heavy metal-binding domain-containing protein [Methanobacterium sp.]|nr:heavy metal-binding domain-containing protein [Methanobacterium sp.]
MVTTELDFLKENRWALIAVILGTLVGFLSAYLCIIWHLVIFGFNIMYIVSPLLAGFIETYIARKKYGRSTGAISALFTFILINFYGWFLPGNLVDPTKEPATLSFITLIAIALTIQAAFPILVNYILFVVVVGIFIKLMSLPSRIMRRTQKADKKELVQTEFISADNLSMPLISLPDTNGNKIKRYMGMVTGEAVAKEKEIDGQFSKLMKMIKPVELDDIYLGDARKLAISRMMERAVSLGANTVSDVSMDFVSVGGLQGNATIVTATGTAVIV